MRGGILQVVLSLCLLAGCDFNSRSNAFTCDTLGNCPVGRVCEMGWCVVPSGDMPDAASSNIDAAIVVPDAAPDATPPDECIACEGDTCSSDCTDVDCSYHCGVEDCECTFSCTADADKCNGTCESDTTCNIDCGEAKQCHPTCETGSICNIDCTEVKDCRKTKCEGDAECLLDCTDTMGMDCKFDVCDGIETSCPDDIVVCGRDCP